MIHSIEEAISRIEAISELQNKLVYDHYTSEQQLPFAAFTYNYITDGADDYKGVSWVDFRLELYSDPRDISLEHKIMIAFDDTELNTSSDYIESERMYLTAFRFRFPYKLTNMNP